MPRQLHAKAVNAGTFSVDHTEPRPYKKTAEKGGWISLEWETFNGRRVQIVRRTIQVSRARAIQAMAALAAGRANV